MVYKSFSDSELISQYKSGDHNAFEVLLSRHKSRIFRFIYLKVKDVELANDFFQEVFIKVINTIQLGTYNDEGKFLPWVLRISNNLVIDYFRKNNKIKWVRDQNTNDIPQVLSMLKDKEDNALTYLSKNEVFDQLHLLLPLLPEEQREIIQFRIFEELSFKEIAELKNLSINTCLGRMRYALINLRKMIEDKKLLIEAELF
ncbi:MAG: sigma-70 family RNA polymerase sigma factor [Flavobacteriia bacterium]|nr:sigma-70 family RNA polymerase sigma factor [Flavobacteriia bacterium]